MKIKRLKPISADELIERFKKQVEKEGVPENGRINLDFSDMLDINPENIEAPRVWIEPLAYIKMMALVRNSNKEIAWQGFVHRSDNNYLIQDIVVYPQIASAATVDADEQHYGMWLHQFEDRVNSIRMQGHSHVQMAVNPSGTDLKYYETLAKQTPDFYIFLIVNKANEIHIRFYDKTNMLLFTDLPLTIHSKEECDIDAWLKEQMLQVKEFVYSPVRTYQNQFFGNQENTPPSGNVSWLPQYSFDDRD